MAWPNSKNYNDKNTYYLVCQWCLSAWLKWEMLDHASDRRDVHFALSAHAKRRRPGNPGGIEAIARANSSLPGGRLALDRVNVDGAQPAHSQHFHRKRPVDPVAIQDADQVVDAVDVDAVEFDDDIAG
jgi:hypothetical protein